MTPRFLCARRHAHRMSGFSLLEITMVIAIIALLSSMILTNTKTAQDSAEDTLRKLEIIQISRALEAYYNDVQSYPPDTVAGYETTCKTSPGDLFVLVSRGYFSALPCDPVNTGDNGVGLGYFFNPTGVCDANGCSQYCVYTTLEKTGDLFGRAGGDAVGCPGT